MKHILINGYIGFQNFGDEAILHVLLKSLKDQGCRKENINVISNNVKNTLFTHGVNAVNRWNPFNMILALFASETVIFIGGLFQDRTSLKSFLYYYCILFIAWIAGKQVVYYGIGIDPFKKDISRKLFKYITSKVKFITVRDNPSASLISYNPNVVVSCDPAVSIEPDYGFKLKIDFVNWELKSIGVALKPDKNLKSLHLTNLASKIAQVTAAMKDWQVLLIPCKFEDLFLLYDFYDLLKTKVTEQNKIILLEHFSDLSVQEQAGVLASCTVMVGMRYHSLLIPMIYGKSVFGLIYDFKVKNLLDSYGQVGVVPKDNFDSPWSYFWQNIQHSSETAKQAKQKALNLHKKNISLLERVLRM